MRAWVCVCVSESVSVWNQCAYSMCTYTLSVCMCIGTGRGGGETVGVVNGQAVRFSKSGGPLVETLSESKSFLERQTLLIFLLFSIFFMFI